MSMECYWNICEKMSVEGCFDNFYSEDSFQTLGHQFPLS